MEPKLMLEAAQAISRSLSAALSDVNAERITLSRDEALLALGLIDGVAELLAREAGTSGLKSGMGGG